jgi:hypothetical protein
MVSFVWLKRIAKIAVCAVMAAVRQVGPDTGPNGRACEVFLTHKELGGLN